ncbi:hypothetical protein L1049_015354 [Liquidambar formosana]|uniref:F-box domain-containing protein n=1 Tax=Liquidambar formosana TaxID=63359 RepID=A0AAP0X2G8_LIQFO
MTSAGKRSLHSPAAETVAGNGDLLSEILLRLPVRSLMRFESVSKKWLSLISDPHFAQDHTRRHNPNSDSSGLLLNHNYAGIQFIPFNQNGGDESRVRLSNPDCPVIFIHEVNEESSTNRIDIYSSETRSGRYVLWKPGLL